MDWKTLKRIADEGSINAQVDNNTGIVTVNFLINGGRIDAQFSASQGGSGLYAFSIWKGASLLKVLKLETTGENDE